MPDSSLFITGDGSHSIHSSTFGVPYHSIHGAIQETQHVFIDAGLKHKLKELKENVTILEIGLGTGLNAFMTYLFAERHKIHLNYTALEAYPISLEQAYALNYADLLAANEKATFIQLHKSSWDQELKITDHFEIHKIKTLFQNYDFPQKFDLIYMDAFAPNAQAEFWEEPFLSKLYNCLLPAGVVCSYYAKGSFKRTLKAVGFKIEALPGPPSKREMTRAIKIS